MTVAHPFNDAPFPYHHEVEIGIENITNLGLGVGRHEGWVIMVPFVIGGERVRCRIFRNHSHYSEADLVAVLDPSPQRMEPLCPLFGICGGCQYQHIHGPTQRDIKRRQVQELLQRLGHIDCDVRPTIGTEQLYHYRSKLTPHFGKGIREIGFLKAGSRSHIIDVERCYLATHAINERLKTLRQEIKTKSLKRGGTLLLRDTGQGIVTDPKQIIGQSIGRFEFQVQAGEFFQNNPHILETFVDHIIGEASAPSITHLIDAYCGVGVFGICGSSHFRTVTAIEINESAINLARKNAQINAIGNIRFIAGSAENIFAGELPEARHTAIILDPPRKGCDSSFLRQLVQFSPQRIIYVSCSPDTQARDTNFLVQCGYRTDCVQPFDFFPQTRHIENVITFSKTTASN
ncbi:MAG: class I SAM-dependent RNA methyltransferase [Puniceicoccales bacterium]|jgi:23S rRNA (uracil1939-C5)-methyltransferase/tRNA (uracil-5-)-methyltransferase|nr:class I SAM-dependent RNA methyltransferase [Puniceicoccales bacterium]